MQSTRLAPSDSRKKATSPSPQPTSSTGELPMSLSSLSASPPRKPSRVSIAPRDAHGYHIAPSRGFPTLIDLSRSWYWLPSARSVGCDERKFRLMRIFHHKPSNKRGRPYPVEAGMRLLRAGALDIGSWVV